MKMVTRKDSRMLPTLGLLRLGEKLKNGLPRSRGYFVCKQDTVTSLKAVKAFRKVYGKKPRKLFILLPCEDENVFFLTKYRHYCLTGKNPPTTFLRCSGDGKKAFHIILKTEELRKKKCDPVKCRYYASRKCRRVGNLYVILPSVPLRGVWRIDTTSFNSIVNIDARISALRRDFRRVSGIPIALRIVSRVISSGGNRRHAFYCLDLVPERRQKSSKSKIGSRKRRS